jgi:alcohol dehydrogenase class IV
MELRKFVAPEIIFGVDARLMAGRCAQHLELNNCLLLSDPGVVAAGWTGEIEQSLADAKIGNAICTDVSPNPKDFEVRNAASFYRQNHCDGIVAIGGGSVLDCAKGIAILVSNGGDILDYEGVDMIQAPMPPLICIPTTGGSSADVSQFAIITNTREQKKVVIISKAIVPDVALVDPVTLTTMSPQLTAHTGMDVLSHAVESFVSNASSPLTDMNALESIRLLASSLIRTVTHPDDLEARNRVMLASLQAGLAFSNASLGVTHAMSHSLGGFKDLPHGECNSLLLPHVIDYNFSAEPERFKTIAEALGINVKGVVDSKVQERLITHIIEFRSSLGIEGGLKKRGVSASDLDSLARKASMDPCNVTNPRTPSIADITAIFDEAL